MSLLYFAADKVEQPIPRVLNEECGEAINDAGILKFQHLENLVFRFVDRVDWKVLSGNPSLPINLLTVFPDKEWDWGALSSNPSIQTLLTAFPDKSWDWVKISSNPAVTSKFIRDNPKLRWSTDGLMFNHTLTPKQIIQLCRTFSWKVFPALSIHPKLTVKTLLKYPKYGWNWETVSRHPNMTDAIKSQHPELGWVDVHKPIFTPIAALAAQHTYHGIISMPEDSIIFIGNYSIWSYCFCFPDLRRKYDIRTKCCINCMARIPHPYFYM